jgi:hypothetical protein
VARPDLQRATDAKNLPAEFGKDKNLLWSATLPGPSNNTPIVLGDRVFTTAVVVEGSRKMFCLCLDRKTGKVLWQKEAGIAQLRPKGENNVAAPSPATDGKVVVFLFGTGDLLAFEPDGKPLWARNLQREVGEWNVNWIYGSSPLLHKGKLYVQVLHTDTPYRQHATAGGEEVRRRGAELPAGAGPDDRQAALAARPPDRRGEGDEGVVRHPDPAHDGRRPGGAADRRRVGRHRPRPETGKELWRFSGWDPNHEPYWRLIPSVVTGRASSSPARRRTARSWHPRGRHRRRLPDPQGVGHQRQGADQRRPGPAVLPRPLLRPRPGRQPADQGRAEDRRGGVGDEARGRLQGRRPGQPDRGRQQDLLHERRRPGVGRLADDGKVIARTALEGNAKTNASRGSVAAVDGMLLIRVGDTMYAFGQPAAK